MKIIIEKLKKGPKKYKAIYDDGKEVKFGSSKHDDYLSHQDPKRKDRYIKRHGGESDENISTKEDWTKTGIKTRGWLSRWWSWNKPTVKETQDDIMKRFGIEIVPSGF